MKGYTHTPRPQSTGRTEKWLQHRGESCSGEDLHQELCDLWKRVQLMHTDHVGQAPWQRVPAVTPLPWSGILVLSISQDQLEDRRQGGPGMSWSALQDSGPERKKGTVMEKVKWNIYIVLRLF